MRADALSGYSNRKDVVVKQGLIFGGAILFVGGILMLVLGGVSWTKKETILQVGDAKVEAEKKDGISFPTVLSVIAIGAGGVLLVTGFVRPRG